MARRGVRQFGAQAAPTRDRGYSSLFASMPVDYGVPAIPPAGPRPPEVTLPPVVDLSGIPEIPMLVPPSATAQIPRTMGTPALPPDWYPETPNRVWSPQPQPTTDPRLQRYTGEEDIPTVMPPAYGQPNVGVDITPEQFTLPPQQRIIQERPPVVDYGPITTPIERPLQEEMGYIEPQPPLDLTPGPQIAGTEQAFYEPQPVESAYAAPIQADYPYPQPQPQPTDIPQDDITNLIDAIIPETLESKTIDIPQEGPQWVEDPYTLAAQEAIDQAAIAQTNPSIYSPAMPPIIGEAPEITLADQIQQEDPYVIDYSDTYGEPILPQQELPQIFAPEPILGEPEVILPQEVGMPEIPTAATTTGGPDDQVIWEPEGMPHGQSGSGVFEYTTDPLGDPVLQPGIVRKRLIGDTGEGTPVGMGPVITEGGVIVGERPESGIAETAETVIPAKTITPSGEVVGEADKTYTVDTEAGLDITQLPETAIAGEPAEGPMIEQIAETPETFVPKDVPPPPAVVEGGGEVVTQPPPPVSGPGVQQGALTAPGPGGWLYTGPQGYAQTRWSTSGAAQGDPVISYTPAVSGPQVNRETGEITEQPLSWWSNRAGYDFMQPGAELPTGKVGGNTVPGAPSPPTGTETGTGTWQQGAEPSPLPRNLHKNDWTSSVTSTANVQNFLDEATRAGVPVVQVDGFGNPRINFSSSTWSTASDAGVDAEGLSKINFKDTDGNTRNAFEVGVNFVGKGIKGAYNLVFGNSGDQSAKDLASNLGEKETASFGKRVKALWKEYAMPFETDDKDPNNLVNPLTGEIQKKGDMQYGFMYNVVTGNIPALAGQMGLHIGHKVFEGLSQGLKRVFGSDVLQSVTSGVMDTLKFAGNKMGQFLGLDAFNKKIESKDFETQEMQDWEQAYGEGAKGKEEGEEEIEGTDPEWMKIWDTLQIDALNPHGIGEGDAPPEFSVEAFDKKLQAGEVTDVSGEGTRFAVFTDRTGQILSTNALNVGSKSWSDADKINVVKGGDGNAWAVVREGGVEVSRPITHGWGANKTPVKANEFGDQGVGGGGGGGLLKTIWEWITSKRE